MAELQWEVRVVPISELKSLPNNPRKLEDVGKQKLEYSLKKFGDFGVVVLNDENKVLSGNQRINILEEKGVTEVVCKVPNRKLTKEEEQEIILRANITNGVWDYEKLQAEFDEVILMENDLLSEAMKESAKEMDSNLEKKPNSYIIRYEIIFDNEDQQETWYKFMKQVNQNYADIDTFAGRLQRALQDTFNV